MPFEIDPRLTSDEISATLLNNVGIGQNLQSILSLVIKLYGKTKQLTWSCPSEFVIHAMRSHEDPHGFYIYIPSKRGKLQRKRKYCVICFNDSTHKIWDVDISRLDILSDVVVFLEGELAQSEDYRQEFSNMLNTLTEL